MARILIVTNNGTAAAAIREALEKSALAGSAVMYKDAVNAAARTKPHLLLADISSSDKAVDWHAVTELKKKKRIPLIVLISKTALGDLNAYPEIDDFITSPINKEELAVRINRLLRNAAGSAGGEKIKSNGLIIDLDSCEVTVNGVKTDLTFKEYELLKLLATSNGRVFTREALLDKIWGYDYFGGDRTVDVHIRRLRSKIEDASHSYIETVRNIGYKFVKGE